MNLTRIRHSFGLLAAITRHRFARFLAVGVVNTLFGYSVFAGLFLASGQKTASLVGATILGVIFNFFTTGRVVFNNRRLHKLIPFCLAYALALGFNIVLLNGLTWAGFNALLAQAASLPFVVVVSYAANAFLVFGGPWHREM